MKKEMGKRKKGKGKGQMQSAKVQRTLQRSLWAFGGKMQKKEGKEKGTRMIFGLEGFQ